MVYIALLLPIDALSLSVCKQRILSLFKVNCTSHSTTSEFFADTNYGMSGTRTDKGNMRCFLTAVARGRGVLKNNCVARNQLSILRKITEFQQEMLKVHLLFDG